MLPLKSGKRQRCPLLILLLSIILEVLASTLRQEKRYKALILKGICLMKCTVYLKPI